MKNVTPNKTKRVSEDKKIDKVFDLTLDKLDEMMMSIEKSRQWKSLKNNYNFGLVMRMAMKEILFRYSDSHCSHMVKDTLNEILSEIADFKIWEAKQMKKNTKLN